MDNPAHADAPQPPRADAPRPDLDNGLPEAHDKTTGQIHDLSNFSVSESLGLPLLSKDVGKTSPQPRERTEGWKNHPGALSPREGYFSHFDSRDRLMAAGVALIILGPLFFGMMRG